MQRPLDQVITKNIDALLTMRRDLYAQRKPQEKMADAIATSIGTMRFIWAQALFMGAWILINSHVLKIIKPFDPFPFSLLSTMSSVEAIFLAGFILIGQSRNQALSERRDDLDLQINLLSEHEITQLLSLVDAIGKHLEMNHLAKPNVEDLKTSIEPEMILNKIEQQEECALRETCLKET